MNQEPKITFTDYLKLVSKEIQDNPHTRVGQAYWNIFDLNKNKIFNDEKEAINTLSKLRGSELDPFYKDDLVPFFLTEVSLIFLHEESNNDKKIVILKSDDTLQEGDEYQNWFSEKDYHWCEIPNSLIGHKVGDGDIYRRIIKS